jgi:hypothetical protein
VTGVDVSKLNRHIPLRTEVPTSAVGKLNRPIPLRTEVPTSAVELNIPSLLDTSLDISRWKGMDIVSCRRREVSGRVHKVLNILIRLEGDLLMNVLIVAPARSSTGYGCSYEGQKCQMIDMTQLYYVLANFIQHPMLGQAWRDICHTAIQSGSGQDFRKCKIPSTI